MTSVRLLLLLLTLGVIAVRAQSPDEQYVQIYQAIQDADRLNEAGKGKAAAAKYLEAQDGLRRFQTVFPGWNERVVHFRLNYVAGKLAPLSALIAVAPGATNAAPATNAAVVSTAPTVSAADLFNPAKTNATPPVTVPAPAPTPVPAPPPAPSPELQQQVSALQAEVEQLRAENNRLGAKLKEALSVQPAAVDPRELARAEQRVRSLEKDNELLQVRLRLAAAPPAADGVAELKGKLAEQGEIINALRAENEILKRRERETSKGPGPVPSASGVDAQQVENLKARVATLEAKPVPYTPDELALMSRPPAVASPNVVASASTSGAVPPPAEGNPKKPSKELPPGTGPIVAAAERAFAQRNYGEAEKKYLDVLRQDENNISILANLASTQLELGHVDDAEKNARKALSGDPEDYFALYVLGRVKFREEKMDDALDALSRSAKANPDYAETQNYLGIVLSEKGLRIPAEAALRRAVQLQPNHAAAHNNLAVVYATQTPPAYALARWHYQKALAAGHPRNSELEKLLEEKK